MYTHFPVKLFSELTYVCAKCHSFSHISLLRNGIWDSYNFLVLQIHFLHEIFWMQLLSPNTKNFTFQLRPIILSSSYVRYHTACIVSTDKDLGITVL